jgi:hypothetical protein
MDKNVKHFFINQSAHQSHNPKNTSLNQPLLYKFKRTPAGVLLNLAKQNNIDASHLDDILASPRVINKFSSFNQL